MVDVTCPNPYREGNSHYERETELVRGHHVEEDGPWHAKANERKAKVHDTNVLKLDEYVAWQQTRVDNWVERDLIVRKGAR